MKCSHKVTFVWKILYRLFHIYEIDESCHQGEERIFGDVMDIADYPETTSLQRNLKQYLLKGNTLGMARGIFYYHR